MERDLAVAGDAIAGHFQPLADPGSINYDDPASNVGYLRVLPRQVTVVLQIMTLYLIPFLDLTLLV